MVATVSASFGARSPVRFRSMRMRHAVSPLEARVWCALVTEHACLGQTEGQLVISGHRITI